MADIGFRPRDLRVKKLRLALAISELEVRVQRYDLQEEEITNQLKDIGSARTATIKTIEQKRVEMENLDERLVNAVKEVPRDDKKEEIKK